MSVLDAIMKETEAEASLSRFAVPHRTTVRQRQIVPPTVKQAVASEIWT